MAISRLLPLLQLGVLFYVIIAVIYTTHYFFIFPANACLSKFLNPTANEHGPWLPFLSSSPYPAAVSRQENEFPDPSSEAMYWNTSTLPLYSDLDIRNIIQTPMTEDLFLSKAFSQSMKPTNIIPFFYRASGIFDEDDITITTLITSNRFKVFSQLVQQYGGPISVTVHVSNTSTDIRTLLDALHTLYTTTPKISTFVDVHLVIDSFDRQFNTWRNIARLFARTSYVMMLDVDFALCTNFRTSIRNSKVVMEKLKGGHAAFVVPAFEYVNRSQGMDQTTFPRDKESLRALVKSRQIGMFHLGWPVGHNSTNYPRFLSSPPGEIYKVTEYQSAYEPYVIFKKEGPPWCDERFVGYGGNKAACLFEMYLWGVSFYVLSDHFIIHQNHAYEETARKNERKYNRKIYTEFKEEACLRYLRAYRDTNMLDTTKGYNVQQECKKIKGLARVGVEIIDGARGPASLHP